MIWSHCATTSSSNWWLWRSAEITNSPPGSVFYLGVVLAKWWAIITRIVSTQIMANVGNVPLGCQHPGEPVPTMTRQQQVTLWLTFLDVSDKRSTFPLDLGVSVAKLIIMSSWGALGPDLGQLALDTKLLRLHQSLGTHFVSVWGHSIQVYCRFICPVWRLPACKNQSPVWGWLWGKERGSRIKFGNLKLININTKYW